MRKLGIVLIAVFCLPLFSQTREAVDYQVGEWQIHEVKFGLLHYRNMTCSGYGREYTYRQEIMKYGIKSHFSVMFTDSAKLTLLDSNNDGVPERQDLRQFFGGDTLYTIIWLLPDSLHDLDVVLDAGLILLGKLGKESVAFQPAPDHRQGHFSKDLDTEPKVIPTIDWFKSAFAEWLTADAPRNVAWRL